MEKKEARKRPDTNYSARKRLRIPSLPAVIVELLKASRDDSSSLAYLADLAGKDPALAAQILRMANSPLINPGKPVKSLSHAAVILGINTMRHLAVSISVCQTLGKIKLPEAFSLKDFWQHSQTTAVIARIIARQTGYQTPEEAFVAGLLHDIGQLFLIVSDPESADSIVQDPDTGRTILTSERKIWNTDHPTIGAEVLEGWKISPSIVDTVRYHHWTEVELKHASELVKIIAASDLLSHYFTGNCQEDIHQIIRRISDFLDWSMDDPALLREEIGGEIEEIAFLLGIRVDWHGNSNVPRVDPRSDEFSNELQQSAIDIATLAGTMEALAEVKGVQQLTDTVFSATTLLTDFDSIILMLLREGKKLSAFAAKGTLDDSYASDLEISLEDGTIWSETFKTNSPLCSDDFLSDKSDRPPEKKVTRLIFDEQIEKLLQGPFVTVPMRVSGTDIGIMILGTKETGCSNIADQLSLISIIARQCASLLQGIRYRQQWNREHRIKELILQEACTGIIFTDEKGDIIYLNPGACKILDIAPDEIFGLNIFSHLKIDTPHIEEMKDQGQPWQTTINRKRSDGKEQWISLRISYLWMNGCKRFIIFLNDETDGYLLKREQELRQKLLEIELKEKTLELQELHRRLLQTEKSGIAVEMARKVVHEASNPLNVIKNLFKLLKKNADTGKIPVDTINALDQEIDRVSRIIKTLTELSRSAQKEKGRNSHIQEAIRDLLPLLAPVAEQHGIKIKIQIPETLPAIAISKDKLKQILLNLLKNSVEALQEAEPEKNTGEIILSAREQDGKRILIEIRDNGPGIPESIREHIFDPFVSSKTGEERGMGLSICMGIVQAAGGEIYLQQTEDRGTCFHIILPAAQKEITPQGG